MVDLKSIHGGSTPPFLVNLFELEQMQALRMCGKEGGSHAVTLHWFRSVLLLELHVWQQMLLK